MDKKAQSIEVTKQIPIVGCYDVVVCGGGASGFISAIAAAAVAQRLQLWNNTASWVVWRLSVWLRR